MAAKELSNNEHNAKVHSEIQKLQSKIDKLKETLLPVDPIKFATLAECNAMAKGKK